METNTRRCSATTKRGTPCTLFVVGDAPLCVFHQRAKEIGARGGKRAAEVRRETRRALASDPVKLRSTDACLSVLEAELAAVRASTGGVVQRASAVTRLIDCAQSILKAGEIEAENEELRKLLLEKHPELKTMLRRRGA